MMQLRLFVVVAVILILVGGCQRTKIPPPATSPPGSPAANRDTEKAPGVAAAPAVPASSDASKKLESVESESKNSESNKSLNEKDEQSAETKTADGEVLATPQADATAAQGDPVEPNTPASEDTASITATADADKLAAPQAEAPPPGESVPGAEDAKERIVLLAPGGPLVVDVRLRFHGESIEGALENLIDDVMKVTDEDGDGTSTWLEVANSPRFATGQYGNLVADTDEERQQLIRIYDADNDGLVDREELPRFVTRNVGGGKSFSMRSSNLYRSSNRRRSPTRLLIDHDRDGAMTPEEIADAPAVLSSRDVDDDEVVTLNELRESPVEMMQPAGMMANRRRVTEPDTAIWLTDKSVDMTRRWGMVQFQIQELYAFGDGVSSGDWPHTPELFRLLDSDQDGSLSRAELPGLAEVPAHLELDVQFDNPDGKPGPRLKLQHVASEVAARSPKIHESEKSASIRLPHLELEFFVNEDPALTNAAQAVRTQFEGLDRDQNGYLQKDEVPGNQLANFAASFESLDADGDEKVYVQEIVDFVQQRNRVTSAQVRARAADQEDALFVALDANLDGQLSARELRRSSARLATFDQNGDSRVHSDEIPGSMVLAFVRGNAQQDDQLFAMRRSDGDAGDKTSPRWFRGMDSNGDDEVSTREFFGSADQFQKLDSDHDGYLSPEEAAAAK